MRDPRRELDPGHVWEVQEARVRRYVRARFDRLRYARRVLDALSPVHIDVMLYEGHKDIRVERGRAWRQPPGFFWATVAIPPDASREEIVFALIALTGVEAAGFLVDALLALDGDG